MRLFFLVISISLLSNSFAQDSPKYRFSFGVSALSIMNYGLRDLENVPSPIYGHTNKVYQTEKYTLDYENFTFSRRVSYQFAAHLISRKKYSLRFGGNIFTEKYEEELTYTLTDIGNESIIDYGIYTSKYTSQDVGLGYSREVTYKNHNRKGVGYGIDLLFLRQLKNNFKLGVGICYYEHSREEWIGDFNNLDYLPLGTSIGRGSNSYRTKKIGLSLEFQKTYKRFNAFINFNQAIYTAKSQYKKGGTDFYTYDSIVPISQNLDFRFSLIIKSGIAVEFGEIFNKKEFRTIGTPSF